MNTSYLVPDLKADGTQALDAHGKPAYREEFGLHPDTPKPAPTAGRRRTRRPGEEADLPDESVLAAELAAARAEKAALEDRATFAEQQLAAERAKATALDSVMKSLGVTPEQIAEAAARVAAGTAGKATEKKK